MDDILFSMVIVVAGFLGWNFYTNFIQNIKESKKDEEIINRIKSNYNVRDLSEPVNKLIDRIRKG